VTRRSALFSGLAVLLVLLCGQVVGVWNARPPTDVASVSSLGPRDTAPPTAPNAPPAPSPEPDPTAGPGRTGGGTKPPPRKRRGKQTRAQQLAALGVQRSTGGRGVVLTFDDGPHPAYTPQILALLRKHRVKATFCLVGTQVRRYPRLVAQIAREGHTLCNHSWHHELYLGREPAGTIRQNLARTSAEIRRAVPGARIPYYRQPGGLWTASVVRAARELGMASLDWSVDPVDWKKPPARAIVARVRGQVKHGSVILLHDAGGEREGPVAACRTLVPELRRRFGVTVLR
jgi:peptidoglycan/xylan/chitin deacetylase (PgdA/CDA1 family)